MEIWRIVEGYKSRYGCYRVSNMGRVKNGLGKELLYRQGKKGYVLVRMIRDGKARNVSLHRVVASAFIPNPDHLPQVNHLDADKKNNRLSNLQWCTNAVNYAHAKTMGILPIRPKGSQAYTATITEEIALAIRNAKISPNGRGGMTRKNLAEKYGVSIHIIKDIRNNRSWTHI